MTWAKTLFVAALGLLDDLGVGRRGGRILEVATAVAVAAAGAGREDEVRIPADVAPADQAGLRVFLAVWRQAWARARRLPGFDGLAGSVEFDARVSVQSLRWLDRGAAGTAAGAPVAAGEAGAEPERRVAFQAAVLLAALLDAAASPTFDPAELTHLRRLALEGMNCAVAGDSTAPWPELFAEWLAAPRRAVAIVREVRSFDAGASVLALEHLLEKQLVVGA